LNTVRTVRDAEDPRDRLFCLGPQNLSDSELLSVALGSDANDVSRSLLDEYGGLRGIVVRESAELSGQPGIDSDSASRLRAIGEISRRLEAPDPERISYSSSTDVAEYYLPLFAHIRTEVFTVLMLDARNQLIREKRVSEGSLTASIVHPREVFRLAICESAASVIFLHNHPSGCPTPSQDDLKITRQLVEAGRLIDIRVLDHIILGYKKFTSLASKGMI
jgi:DNA repair protein RadC